MSQRIVGRTLAVGALVATLTLSIPGRAEALDFRSPGDLLSWLARTWEGLSEIWAPASTPAQGGGTIQWDSGPCIDPDGRPCQGPASTVAPGDQGACTDPDG